MEYIEFKEKFYEELKKIGLEEINENNIEKFFKYMNLLKEWNKKINLTAIIEDKDIITKHFIDSLTINKYIKQSESIIDVGTGAGFPGLPLKIINEDINVTLLDSLNKRIKFLNDIIEKCELDNVEAVHARVEEFAINNKEKYDIATSRAVAKLAILLEYLLPLVKVGGYCICMKGKDTDEEINEAEKALNILGGSIEKIEKFELPGTDNERTIIIIKKANKTPAKYPRKAGIPTKEPIV